MKRILQISLLNILVTINVFGQLELSDFKIYNRWGVLVFKTNDLNVAWDGNKNGRLQNSGTYVYVIEYLTNNESYIKKGNITLIR